MENSPLPAFKMLEDAVILLEDKRNVLFYSAVNPMNFNDDPPDKICP